uniref:Uncharacterized protein n=1 Tax=Glossina pallidipes TaxID=7398 RepID=A0A1A9ZU71_GLOPL
MHLKVCKTMRKVSKPILCLQTDNTKYDTHMVNMCNDFEVQPIYVRKQPKFPTRERNLAVRLRYDAVTEKQDTTTILKGSINADAETKHYITNCFNMENVTIENSCS